MDGNFWVWAIAVLAILGVGGGAIAITSTRPLGDRAPFTTPVTNLSAPVSTAAAEAFNAGISAFQAKNYLDALDAFNRVLTAEPNCAEAVHNRALTHANLGKLNLAVPDFLKASELYDQQGTKAGVDAVRAALEQLA